MIYNIKSILDQFLDKYNTDNKTNFDNLQEIIDLHIKLEFLEDIIRYCN